MCGVLCAGGGGLYVAGRGRGRVSQENCIRRDRDMIRMEGPYKKRWRDITTRTPRKHPPNTRSPPIPDHPSNTPLKNRDVARGRHQNNCSSGKTKNQSVNHSCKTPVNHPSDCPYGKRDTIQKKCSTAHRNNCSGKTENRGGGVSQENCNRRERDIIRMEGHQWVIPVLGGRFRSFVADYVACHSVEF